MFKMSHVCIVLLLAWSAIALVSFCQVAPPCTCVPYYLCAEGNVVTSEDNIFRERFGFINSCNSTLSVCCKGVTDPPITPTPPPTHTPKCGVRNTEGVNALILNPLLDKDVSKFAEFPWQSALLRKSSFGAKGLYSCISKVVDVLLVDNSKCQEFLRKTRLTRSFNLHTSFLCAGGEKGIDACKGDGGGPLVCEEHGTYTVTGIVAWGIGCGDENVPGVYVKVSQFTTWIEEIIAAKNISLTAQH